MAQPHDELFAKFSIQTKLLAPAQVMACRDVQAELESAGVTRLLAAVAVDQGALKRADAVRLIDAINRKMPGRHPALPEPPVAAPEPEAPPARKSEPKPAPRKAPAPAARPSPAARRPAARTAPAAPAPKGNSRLFLILGGVAAVAVIAVVAIVLSGKKEPPRDVAKTPEVSAEIDAKPPKSEPKVEIKPEPKPEVKAPPPPPPPPPPVEPPSKSREADARKEFEERMAERRKEALAHLEEVKRELAAERKEAELAAEETRKRLGAQKVSLALTSGETYKDAVIESFTFHGADLLAGGRKVRITWDTVQPASLTAVAEVLYDPKQPGDLFERGRFFVGRRMWKDAQAAFGAAAKLGGGYESRVLEFSEVLDRLVSGQGGFRGSARRIGRDGVRLAWDFHDPKQLEDFTAGLAHSGKAVQLESARKAAVFFFGGTSSGSGDSPLAFRGEVSAEMKLACDGPVTFHLFTGDIGGGYELDLGPAGASLFRIDPKARAEKDRRKTVARSDKVKLAAGKVSDVRLTARYPRFVVTVDGAEALSAEAGPVSVTADPPKGPFGFGIEKGKLRIESPMAIQGRAEASELDRRINDTEVMVRRALDPDLEQIERFRARRKAMQALGETRELSLSSDDPYFAFRIRKFEDITKYEDLKKHIGGIPDKQTPQEWKAEMDAMTAKYPDVPSLYFIRALFKHAYQDYLGALADVKKAVEIFPEFHEALELHAQMLLEMQDAEGAMALIRKAVEARPDYVEGYVTRARCVFATTQSMQAFMEDLDVARKLDPQDSTAVQVQRMLKYQRLGPRELGCRFDYETPHYKVTTDISPEAAKRYGENLEAAFRHYSASFKGASARPGKKPRVAIFNTAENYYTYFELLSEDRGEHTAGVFRGALNELVLFENGDVVDTNHTLYHEAVHQFMTLLTNRTPPFWYNEGIAEYMGSIKVQDGKVLEKAIVLKGRLPYIQLGIEVKADLPFEKIMNETPGEFYSGNVGLKYAQAWSMIHFFYEHEKGKYRPLIEEYFESLRAGKTPRECYDAVFKAKAETLQQEWRDFTKNLKP